MTPPNSGVQYHDVPTEPLSPGSKAKDNEDYDPYHATHKSSPSQPPSPLPYEASPAVNNARDRRESWLGSSWIVQTLALAASCLSLAGLAVLADQLNGKPLPSWSKRVSVNSIISILSGVMKACLGFLLSEGIAQLKWLWFNKPRRLSDLDKLNKTGNGSSLGAMMLLLKPAAHWVANLGAFLVLLTLAIDPFSQQLIKYQECNVPLTSNVIATTGSGSGNQARVSRTNTYVGGGVRAGGDSASLDSAMVTAIYTGFLNPSSPSSSEYVRFVCGTGNCSFVQSSPPSASSASGPNGVFANGGAFSTLAMCSTCTDISSQIVDAGNAGGVFAPENYTLFNRTWVQGNRLVAIDATNMDSAFASGANADGNLIAEATNGVFEFNILMNGIVDTCLNGTSPNGTSCSQVGKPFAASCQLTPCVKTFDAEIKLGVYTEKETGEVALRWVWADPFDTTFSLAMNQTIRNGELVSCNPTQQQTSENTISIDTRNMTLMPIPDGTDSNPDEEPLFDPDRILWYPQDCVYSMDYETTFSIGDWLKRLFNTENPVLGDHADAAHPTGEPWAINLYNYGLADINTTRAFMQSVAWSMTGLIRLGGFHGTESQEAGVWAEGIATATQTCVSTEWKWFSLLAILPMLTLVFFIATLVQQAKMETKISFGSSLVPPLFIGFDQETRDKYDGLLTKKDIMKAARDMTVELKKDETGAIRFVEVVN